MRLIDALKILREPVPESASSLNVFLACGFTPLHLQTFLAAHLRRLDAGRVVRIQAGFYGDNLGNLERLATMRPLDSGAVALEWSDFDSRLGLRQLGGWNSRSLEDILATVDQSANRLESAIARAAESLPVAICLPTLPIPPLATLPTRQSGYFDLRLRERLSSFSVRVAELMNVRVLNSQQLDRLSPLGARLDVHSELLSGFPYRIPHASAVAELLARLIRPPVPKKGLITDLDETFWRGILGEVGPQGVTWDLDHQSHVHALYQGLLRSLAESGVLVAAASKNEPALVEEAFRRDDLLITKAHLFPLEVHWGPKSKSVERILRAWNIGPDSVVFVDDSPMEVDEVKVVHPEIECFQFPSNAQSVYDLIEQLRELFGKAVLSPEDPIRLESLRRAEAFREDLAARCGDLNGFLALAEAELTLSLAKEPPDPRVLELINKTNQFNLNGNRYAEGAWAAYLEDPQTFLLKVAYQDKYGPLGTIAVIAGRVREPILQVETWVMSCRAFSRRIEHRCLGALFQRFEAKEMVFGFQATRRNKPLQDFLANFVSEPLGSRTRVSRECFLARCPPLHHNLKWEYHG